MTGCAVAEQNPALAEIVKLLAEIAVAEYLSESEDEAAHMAEPQIPVEEDRP